MKKILQGPFRMDYQWWAPIELIRRFLLVVFIIIDPGNLVSIEKKYRYTQTYVFSCYMYVYVYLAT